MKRTQAYEAEDGTTFTTAAECKKHEDHLSIAQLCDLSSDQVRNALARIDIPLADAFERAGNIITANRRLSGELKKSRKGQGGASTFEDVAKAMGAPNK